MVRYPPGPEKVQSLGLLKGSRVEANGEDLTGCVSLNEMPGGLLPLTSHHADFNVCKGLSKS